MSEPIRDKQEAGVNRVSADFGLVTPAQNRDLILLINDVDRMLRRKLDQFFGAYELSGTQWALITHLSQVPGVSQGELAKICRVDPMSVVRSLDRLEARGFVLRYPDGRDRRVKRLRLLPAARRFLRAVEHERCLLQARLTTGLGSFEQSLVIDALLHIRSHL